MTSRARRLAAATASIALLGLGAAGCSSQSGSDDSGGESSQEAPAAAAGGSLANDTDAAAEAPADAPEAFAEGSAADGLATRAGTSSLQDTAGKAAPVPAAATEAEPGDPRSLIKTGNVALRAQDVRAALFEVRNVILLTRSEVAEENTEADDQGDPERSLLTVRVPVAQFDTALDKLTDLGDVEEGVDLIDSTSSSQDVSTQVIDTDVRVELQMRSIERISILLDRASSIRDIVSIERELARREADLGSLQKRQTFLADQTSLSTITISIERPAKKVVTETKTKDKKDDSGFFAGLSNGWDAFEDVTTGLLTSIGALLPFGILALFIGIPLRVWLRRRQPPAAVGTPDAAAPAGA